MFEGINEKEKKEFRKFNSQSSDYFIFSFADLELVKRNNKRRKCRLVSEELSKELHKTYSRGKSGLVPPIKFIDFESDRDSDNYFPSSSDLIYWNHNWWLKTNKKNIQENSKILQDGTLKFNFVAESDFSERLFGNEEKNLENFCKKKYKETKSVRTSALNQIENTIQNGNIDFTTLKEAMLFLGESYINAWPTDCLHCPKEYAKNPENFSEYHKIHINECLWRPDRIKDFKDSQVALIERIITQFNTYKNTIIQQIINKAQEQGISETELNTTRPNWQNHLRSLKNRKAITDYQTNQLEEDIKKLVAAKKKTGEERQQAENAAKEKAKQEEERLKKEREEKEATEKKQKEEKAKKQAEEQAKQQELKQARTNSISEIVTALDQDPKITNNDLSSQYQNWEEQINQLTDIQQITNLQGRLLADIQARRQDKKSAQEVKENLKKAQTGTKEEQEQAWKDLEKQETEKGYNDNKEEVDKLKKEKATANPREYGKEAKERIAEKLTSTGIKSGELSNENQAEWQKLKNGEITDPKQLVATETKIKQNIYQVEAQKKVVTLTAQVNEVLKSKAKDQIATVKKLLLEFLGSSNIYYSSQKKAVENLLTQLENYSAADNNQNSSVPNPDNFPWKLVIPFLLIGTLLVMILVMTRKRVVRWRKGRNKK